MCMEANPPAAVTRNYWEEKAVSDWFISGNEV